MKMISRQKYRSQVRNTPAHKAAEAGHVDILTAIAGREFALLSSKGAMGATPMHLAAAKVSRRFISTVV